MTDRKAANSSEWRRQSLTGSGSGVVMAAFFAALLSVSFPVAGVADEFDADRARIIRQVERKEGGKVISVKTTKTPGVYRLRILKEGGRVKTVVVDSRRFKKR